MLADDLEVFVAIVEGGSFSKAAKNLRTSQATISRKLQSLEESLTITLISRGPRNFEITPAGKKLYQGLKIQQNELNQLMDQLKQSEQHVSGTVRLSLPIGISFFVISPYLGKFLRDNPELKLELYYQAAEIGLLKDNLDLAIIDYMPNQQSALIRKLASFNPKLYCTKQYIERYGIPRKPSDLERKKHLCSSILNNNSTIEAVDINNQKHTIPNVARLFTNNTLHNKIIIEDGHIIVYGWGPMFTEELKNGTIINVLPDYSFEKFNLYLLRPNNHASAAVETVIKFIESCFARLPN